MPDRVLHLYLPSPMRQDAVAGKVNIVNRIEAAVAPQGWRLAFHADTGAERAKAANRRGWHLFHMQEPEAANTLCLRRAYHYPFWQIEATNERWKFDVAEEAFDPSAVDAAEAADFAGRWRRRILGEAAATSGGFILIPLQGRLLQKRSFQAASPVEMIRAVLKADTSRPVVATLHPREALLPEERAVLDAIAAEHPRFRVEAGSDALLLACDYVVTENSAVAFTGYLAGKRAVLFAGADFHHIAASVPLLGIAGAFRQISGPPPPFAAYVTWFWRRHCINGGAPEAEAQILARLARHGWPVEG